MHGSVANLKSMEPYLLVSPPIWNGLKMFEQIYSTRFNLPYFLKSCPSWIVLFHQIPIFSSRNFFLESCATEFYHRPQSHRWAPAAFPRRPWPPDPSLPAQPWPAVRSRPGPPASWGVYNKPCTSVKQPKCFEGITLLVRYLMGLRPCEIWLPVLAHPAPDNPLVSFIIIIRTRFPQDAASITPCTPSSTTSLTLTSPAPR